MRSEVRESRADDAGAWDAFLSNNTEASFYHRFAWQDINRTQFGHRTAYLVSTDDGRIRGVLPLTLLSSVWFGRILCSLPFVNYGGPCSALDDHRSLLVDHAVAKAREWRADYLELRCARTIETAMPVSTRKISMTIALDPDPEVLWNAFPAKHRKNIRRAYKNDLEVRNGGSELLADFYAVLERSWRDHGTPLYGCRYFRAVLDAFPGHTRIYVCYHAKQPVSCALVGFHNGTAEGMWQGGLPSARDLQANYVLYWEMIRDISLRGFRHFHLGRSTAASGSEQFKARWNAVTQPLYWYYHRPRGGPMPVLNVENPRYRLAIEAWRRLPVWVTRCVGPGLARSIP